MPKATPTRKNADKNRHERLVDGVKIQSKYCATAEASIRAAFNENSGLQYLDGKGFQKLEVPKGQGGDAVKCMAKKLRAAGNSPSVATRMAKNIVIEGHIDWDTACRIIEGGNIHSVTFDRASGLEEASMAGSLSMALSYAMAIWNGADKGDAAREACITGLQVGGTRWLSSMLTAPLSKSAIEQAVARRSGAVVEHLSSSTRNAMASALKVDDELLRTGLVKEAAKRLTGKVAEDYLTDQITADSYCVAVTTLVLSAQDLVRVFNGRISKAQLLKNVTNRGAKVAGGMAGARGGAKLGFQYLGCLPGGPAAGAVVGGLVGGIVGGAIAGKASQTAMNFLIEDDAVQMMRTLEEVFVEEVQYHVLTQAEADDVALRLQAKWDLSEQLREMFASVDPEQYARWLWRPLVEGAVAGRKKVRLPSEKTLLKSAAQVLAAPSKCVDMKPATPNFSTKTIIAPAAWPFPTSSRL